MCRGSQWHPAARMRVCMMQREQQGSPRARAGQGRVMHAHMCTDVRVTVGCAHGYLGCLHAWHMCVSPAPSVCHVYGRKEQGQIHKHTQIHALHLTGRGGDHSFTLLPLFVSPSLTGVCCDYLAGASSCSGSACAAGWYGPPGSTSSSAATCTGLCVAGKYSNAGASRVCLLRCV